MPFKYAAFTVMMPEYSLQDASVLLKELGYDGVEWRVHSVPSSSSSATDYWRGNKATIDIETIVEKAKDIRKITDDIGLETIGLGTYLSCKMLDEVKRCMEAAKIMGCNSVRVSTPKYDGSANYHDLYEAAVDGYAKIEDIARSFRVRANVEVHQGNICSSASLAYRFVSNFDPDYVGVILDPGNMVFEGYENWQLGLELLGPYFSYIHVKNAAWLEGDTSEDGTKHWNASVVPIKEGIVSWPEVLLVLDKVGYKGWMAFEDFAAGDTKTKLSDDMNYLKSLETRLGI